MGSSRELCLDYGQDESTDELASGSLGTSQYKVLVSAVSRPDVEEVTKEIPRRGRFQTVPSVVPIIEPRQALCDHALPNVHTIFSGLKLLVSGEVLPSREGGVILRPGSGSSPRVIPASMLRNAFQSRAIWNTVQPLKMGKPYPLFRTHCVRQVFAVSSVVLRKVCPRTARSSTISSLRKRRNNVSYTLDSTQITLIYYRTNRSTPTRPGSHASLRADDPDTITQSRPVHSEYSCEWNRIQSHASEIMVSRSDFSGSQPSSVRIR